MACTDNSRTRSFDRGSSGGKKTIRYYSRHPDVTGPWVLDNELEINLPDTIDQAYIVDRVCENTDQSIPSGPNDCCKSATYRNSYKMVTHIKTFGLPASPTSAVMYYYKTAYNRDHNINRIKLENVIRSAGPQLETARSYMQFTYNFTEKQISDACRRIRPSTEKFLPGVNLWEILGELKDAKRLLTLFKVNRDNIPAEFMDKHLGYNFGYLPMQNTLLSLFGILANLDSVIDLWNNFAKNGKIMDFHETIDQREEFQTWESANSWIGGTEFETLDTTWKATSTVKSILSLYIHPLPITNNMKFSILAKALGVDKPVSGLWELVPWSWAIDYVFNIGDLISQWETGIDDMFRFNVADLGYSTKGSLICEHSSVGNLWGDSLRTLHLPRVDQEEQYFRVPLPGTFLNSLVIPDDFGARPSDTTLTQWSFLASALGQRHL